MLHSTAFLIVFIVLVASIATAIILNDSTLRVLVKLELHHGECATQEHAARGVQGLQLQVGAQRVALVGLDELIDSILPQVALSKSLS